MCGNISLELAWHCIQKMPYWELKPVTDFFTQSFFYSQPNYDFGICKVLCSSFTSVTGSDLRERQMGGLY